MTWFWFGLTAGVIVVAGSFLARYGDVIGARSGLSRSWTGLALLAATTSLPELFTGIGATAVRPLPNIAIGDVLGSCMFNLVILSLMDLVQPERLTARAHQGHALTIGFGVALTAVVGLGMVSSDLGPMTGWIGWYSPALMVGYLVAMRATFARDRRAAVHSEAVVVASTAPALTLRQAVRRYGVAALFVVAGALYLPEAGAALATETGLGQAFVGSFFIAVTTSLPELVVSLAAVRMGALDLGVGNVLGSNLFNLFILGLDDILYRQGPILAAADTSHLIAVFAVVVMNGVLLVGLTQQVLTKRFRVAWDTALLAAVYVGSVWLMYRLHQAG